MLKIKRNIKLHNKHHIVLTDAKTGEVKQEGWAYNLILTQGIHLLPTYLNSHAWSPDGRLWRAFFNFEGFSGQIFIGTGTGELSAARTNLFTYLDRRGMDHAFSNNLVDRDVNQSEGWASRTISTYWDETEHQSTSITEVGVGRSASGDTLNTHALIEDSEGNPITVFKGTHDILTVYSTLFAEVDHVYNTDQFSMPGIPNWFLGALYHNVSLYASADTDPRFCFYLCRDNQLYPDTNDYGLHALEEVRRKLDSQANTYHAKQNACVASNNTYSATYRLPAVNGNSISGIRKLVISAGQGQELYGPILSTLLPLNTIFESYSIEGEEIGTGDGAETEFNLQWADFVADSEAIKVNSVAQVRGTDYQVHRGFGKGVDIFQGAFVTEDYNRTRQHVTNNFYKLFDGSTSTYLSWTADSNLAGNEKDPHLEIVWDSYVINYASSIRIFGGTSAQGVKDFKFQGSDDKTTWTDLVTDEIVNNGSWQEFNFASEVGYRYWKFIGTTTGSTNLNVFLYELELISTRANIVFEAGSIPADGHSVVADYNVTYIPKDENHVLDIDIEVAFSDANVV